MTAKSNKTPAAKPAEKRASTQRPTTKSKAPEAPPAPAATPAAPAGKLALVIGLMRRPEGARMEELIAATGWQAHRVRGAISGSIRKKWKLPVDSIKAETGRVYRIGGEAAV